MKEVNCVCDMCGKRTNFTKKDYENETNKIVFEIFTLKKEEYKSIKYELCNECVAKIITELYSKVNKNRIAPLYHSDEITKVEIINRKRFE